MRRAEVMKKKSIEEKRKINVQKKIKEQEEKERARFRAEMKRKYDRYRR